MKKYSKLMAVLLVVAMLLPGIAQAAPVTEEVNGVNVTRLGGTDRIGTSVLASQEAYDKADAVVLAGFGGDVDALTGTLLAANKKAPLLITRKFELSDAVKTEIERLGAKTVYILGGETAVGEEVETALEAMTGITVERVEGANRNATAAKVAKEVKGTNADHVFLALGRMPVETDALADALAIGPVSAKNDMPVLLTEKNRLPAETIAAMKDLGTTKVTIIGGTSAISQEVEDMLEDYTVDRVFGDGREDTALEIAAKYFPNPKNLIVAYGRKSADALVGGYLGALKNAPILLTNNAGLTTETKAYISENVLDTFVLGSTEVVPQTAFDQIVEALKGEEVEELKVESVSAINPKDTRNIEVTVKTTGAEKVEMTLVGAGVDETVVIDTDGTATYTFADLPSGSYIVEAVAKAGEETTELVKSTEVVITPANAEQMTGIAGFVRDTDGEGVAGVEVSLGNRKVTTDYNGYYELELAAGIHDITFTSGAGIHIEEKVVVAEGRTTGLVVAETALGVPSIDKNTISASVVDTDGDLVETKVVLQAKQDGKWLDIKEATLTDGKGKFTNADVAGSGFPYNTEYRFEVLNSDDVKSGVYSNVVNFKPNAANNIDLSLTVEKVDDAETLPMDLTLNLRDNNGEVVGNDKIVGTLDLYKKTPTGWSIVEDLNDDEVKDKDIDSTTNSIKIEDLELATGTELMAKFTPDASQKGTEEVKSNITVSGTTGEVDYTSTLSGTVGDGIKIEVVQGADSTDAENETAPSASWDNSAKKLTITLGTTWDGSNSVDGNLTAQEIVDLGVDGAPLEATVKTTGDVGLVGEAVTTAGVDAKEGWAISTRKFTVTKEGENQSENMRLVSTKDAAKATVNFKTADKKAFETTEAGYTVNIKDSNDFPIMTVAGDDSNFTLDEDKITVNTDDFQLPNGTYKVEIKNSGFILPTTQTFTLKITNSSSYVNGTVTTGSPLKLSDGSSGLKYDSDSTATTIGRVIYVDVMDKNGKVLSTERFVNESGATTETVVVPVGKDYKIVSGGFRLTDQEVKNIEVEHNTEKDQELPNAKNAEDKAVISGKVTRNNIPVESATVTAYLFGRAVDQVTTKANGDFTTALELPHAGDYTLVVRGTDVATTEYKHKAVAGSTVTGLEIKANPLQSGKFTITTDSAIGEVEILDSYATNLGKRGFDASNGVDGLNGRWTKEANNVTTTSTIVKAENMTQGEYYVKITPVSSQLDPVYTTINIGRAGAEVSRTVEFPSAANKRNITVDFITSETGNATNVVGTLVARDSNGDVYETKAVSGTRVTIELQDDNYTLRFIPAEASNDVYAGAVKVEVAGSSKTVDLELVEKK